jgi:CRISP-associated protein Cas1
MTNPRVIEVSERGRHLSLFQGFVIVSEGSGGKELGRVPLDDVGAVIFSTGASCTTPLVVALAERGAVVAMCGKNYLPIAWTLPIVGNYAQTRIVAAQVDASKPLNKRLWQHIVQAKVGSQSAVLKARGQSGAFLEALVDLVQSGDPTNIEARAAQSYWPSLFGEGFRRDREAGGINAVLNYGYTVLRASTARAIVAAGLHPSVSIRHRRDPMSLADDLMEPFRGVVDFHVAQLVDREGPALQVTRSVREGLVERASRTWQEILNFVRSIADAFVTGVCPKRGRFVFHVADGSVRFANNDRGDSKSDDKV